MGNQKTFVAIVVVLGFVCVPAPAQDSDVQSVARAYFKTLQTEGLTSVGRFMHPDALESFKTMLLPVFEAEAEAGQAQLRSMTFGAEATIESIKSVDPELFMNNFMNIVAAQAGDVRVSFDKLDIVGVVSEGNQKHVLARITVGAGELTVTEFEVLSFIPFEDTWRLQLNGEMQGIAAALTSRL